MGGWVGVASGAYAVIFSTAITFPYRYYMDSWLVGAHIQAYPSIQEHTLALPQPSHALHGPPYPPPLPRA